METNKWQQACSWDQLWKAWKNGEETMQQVYKFQSSLARGNWMRICIGKFEFDSGRMNNETEIIFKVNIWQDQTMF